MIFLGIDPGLSGGVAALTKSGMWVTAQKMPATERDLLELLQEVRRDAAGYGTDQIRATLEFVRSSPQMGVASAFKFGAGYGGLRMALAASAIPFDEVTPQKWQVAMRCRSGGDKNVTKRRAQELFPGGAVTHAIADALLLAEYGRRLHLGLLHKAAAR